MVDTNKGIGKGKLFLDPIQPQNIDPNIQIQSNNGYKNLSYKPNLPLLHVARQSYIQQNQQQSTLQNLFKNRQPLKVLPFNATTKQSNNNEEEEEEKKYEIGNNHNNYGNNTYNSFYPNNDNLNNKREQQEFTYADYTNLKKQQEQIKSPETSNSNYISQFHKGRNFNNYDNQKKNDELLKQNSEELKHQVRLSELTSPQPIIKDIKSNGLLNGYHGYDSKQEDEDEKNQEQPLNQLSQPIRNKKILTQNNVVFKTLFKNKDFSRNNFLVNNIYINHNQGGIADVQSFQDLNQVSNQINSNPFQSIKKYDEMGLKNDLIQPQDQINSLRNRQQDINKNNLKNKLPDSNLFNSVNVQNNYGGDLSRQHNNRGQVDFSSQQSGKQSYKMANNNNNRENQSLITIPQTIFCDMCSRDIIDTEMRDHKVACELEEIPCQVCFEMISRNRMNAHFLNCITQQQQRQQQFIQQPGYQSQQQLQQQQLPQLQQQQSQSQQEQQIQEQLRQLQEQENQLKILNREQQRQIRQQEEEQNQQIREQRQQLQELQRQFNEQERFQKQQIREQQRLLQEQERQQYQQIRVQRIDLQEQLRQLSRQQNQPIGNLPQQQQKQLFSDVIQVSTGSQENCCICLNEFELGEQLGMLVCTHKFHKNCITQWIQTKKICPLCKIPL